MLRHGDGHAAYLLGNTCLADHVNRYLTEGTPPPTGLRCPGELLDRIPDRPAARGAA
ncbi:alpha/beta hydrolase [Goodfellowiella coeruleoviolacea]|uniref:alpha/beta hydrolase n=1 Tax=Goodfellowiella coeruleoviolacea TaxID=334858 RepID=UPI0020A43BAF|nr:alpha/beta hydrolase [Goodfellowiella coeruleoviolacea]